MNTEIWRDIPQFENYQISNFGRVYSKHKGDIKALEVNKKGYQAIRPYKKNVRKTFRIHRLVAELFIDNPENKPQVNHIDGNKLNNHYSNLEWCTNRENAIHAAKNKLFVVGSRSPNSKLNEDDVKRMRDLYDNHGYGSTKLAKLFGINEKNAYNIVKRKAWKHVI